MAAEVHLDRNTLAAGEVSPPLYGQDDLARQRVGCKRLEGMVVLVEGGAARAPGTRFVDPLKTESEIGKLLPFRFSDQDAYMNLLNGGKMRVHRNGGVVLSGGNPFELTIPWAAADLDNLRMAQDFDTQFIVCTGFQTRELKRLAHDNWTLALYAPKGGPVKVQNLDAVKVLQATGVTGTVTIEAIGHAPFQAGHIGGVWRLDEPDLTSVALWKANEVITVAETLQSGGDDFVGDMTLNGGHAAAFDTVTNQAAAACAKTAGASTSAAFVGRDYGATPRIVQKCKVFGSNDKGFMDEGNPTVTLAIYGKQTAPTLAAPGTLLGQVSFTDTNNENAGREIVSSDAQTAWRYVSVKISIGSGNWHHYCAELQVFSPAAAVTASQRRFNGRVYQALTNGDVGPNPPEHEEGDALTSGGGVKWRFLHNGYGFVRIDAVTDGDTATATVLSRLPDSVVETPTYRWWPSAWDAVEGWPDRVGMFQHRLCFFRKMDFWMTRPFDFWDHEADGTDESAVSGRLRSPDGSLVWVEWALASGVLVLGTRDLEWLLRAATSAAAITVKNLSPLNDTTEGSAKHVPALVEGGALFIGRSKQRLHFARFDRLAEKLETEEVTLSARHILRAKAKGITFQRDPNKLAFIHCEDGSGRHLSFMTKEKVAGWARRPFVNGIVEDAATSPADGGERDETYLIVRRTIDGQTRRYLEVFAPFFQPADEESPTAVGAWFFDSALKYTGAPLTTIAGAAHLKGQAVGIFADGKPRASAVVAADGTVAIGSPASGDVLLGLPLPWKMRSLSFDPQTAQGSTKGKKKQANHLLLETVHAAGGMVAVNGGTPDPVFDQTKPDKLVAPALFTGRVEVGLEAPTDLECVIEVSGDGFDGSPFTLAGFGPDLDVTETG